MQQMSGERLQDHWSSVVYYFQFPPFQYGNIPMQNTEIKLEQKSDILNICTQNCDCV